MAAIFRLYRLRFHFVGTDRVYYPPGKASNVIRGALGTILREIACVPDCASARTCELRRECAYARIFEPTGWNKGPSGLQDPPRPFVLRAAHLDGATIEAGQAFFFDLHLFLILNPPLECFVRAFSQLAETGLGPGRGRVALESVELLGEKSTSLFQKGQLLQKDSLPRPLEFPLQGRSEEDVTSLQVRFVTPMEIKHNGRIASRPEFGLLLTRIAERLGNLCAMYGEGPLVWDWQGLVARAQAVRLVDWKVARVADTVRFSTKTGQRHGVGGWMGEALYEGPGLGEFVPVLEAASFCGAGRHTVWGNGALEVVAGASPALGSTPKPR